MVAKTTHHLFQPLLYQVATGILSQGEIAPPTREMLSSQKNAKILLGEVTGIDLEKRAGHLPGARPADRDAVRLADRGRRRVPVLLRQRPLRRVRTGHEVHRRRPGAARSDLRRLRDGRAGSLARRPRRPPADVRGRGRRADRRGDGGPDRRARAPHPAPRLPRDQHPHRAGDPARRRAAGAAAVRPEARRPGQGRAGEAGRRGDPRRDGHRRRRARHRDEVQGRSHRADRHRHQDLGRRRPGQPARPHPVGADRRPARPGRPDRRQPRPDAARAPRGVRGRRHDQPRPPARRRAGRDPGREVRRQGDRRPDPRQGSAAAVPVLRQGLDGDHQPVPRGRHGRQAAADRRRSRG